MYHDVYRGSTSESGFQNDTAIKYKVRASDFENQVATINDYLKSHNLPKDSVEFTFDDGGESFLTIIAPILEKYGFRGKFYISTGKIGTKGFLNEAQVKELHSKGHIVGSHSHSHPERMSAMSKDEIDHEWNQSQNILKEILGFSPKYASIPNGYQSKAILESMISSGITVIDTSATTTRQRRFKSALVRGRYAVTDDMTVSQLMKLLNSPAYRFKIAMRWYALSFAKKMLGNTYLSIRSKLVKK